MELATKDLATVIKEGCSNVDKYEFVKGIAAGLTYIHHELPTPILHRDLKVSSLSFTHQGLTFIDGV
jgi:serine/threonine protein kinase